MFEYKAVGRFVALKVPTPKIEFQSWAFSPILMIIIESNAHVKQIQYMDDDDDDDNVKAGRGSYHLNYYRKYLMAISNQISRFNACMVMMMI